MWTKDTLWLHLGRRTCGSLTSATSWVFIPQNPGHPCQILLLAHFLITATRKPTSDESSGDSKVSPQYKTTVAQKVLTKITPGWKSGHRCATRDKNSNFEMSDQRLDQISDRMSDRTSERTSNRTSERSLARDACTSKIFSPWLWEKFDWMFWKHKEIQRVQCSGFIECRIWIFCKCKHIETTGVSGKSKSICQLFCFSKQNVPFPFHCHISYSFVLSEKEIWVVAQRQKLGFASVGNDSNEITSKVYHTVHLNFLIYL